MASNARKIDPLDLQPRKAIGVSLPFSGNAVFNSTYQTKDAIKANIVNYFLTGPGERYMTPQFGTPLRNLLFENITDQLLDEAEDLVTQGLGEYFPNVEPIRILAKSTPDTNGIQIYINYAIRDTGIEDNISITFEQ